MNICFNCEQECDVIEVPVLEPYEFHGTCGVHRFVDRVSSCCATGLLERDSDDEHHSIQDYYDE